MEQLLLDQVVESDYGQFDLVWDDDGGFDGDWARFFAGHVNGLVGAADPKGVYVNLARRSPAAVERLGGRARWNIGSGPVRQLPPAGQRKGTGPRKGL